MPTKLELKQPIPQKQLEEFKKTTSPKKSSKKEGGFYITKNSNSYHSDKSCASRGGGSNCYWYADANQARTGAQTKFKHKVTRCNTCC